MSIPVITRSELVRIGEWPPGCQSDIAVDMDPAEDTTGFAMEVNFSLKRDGAVIPALTLTTAGGGVTVGNSVTDADGATKKRILIKMATISTLTAALTGTYWIHVRRTDSGQHDRYALATLVFTKPVV